MLEARPAGTVEIIKSTGIGEHIDPIYGKLDDLSKHIGEDAAVEWDRFVEENGIEIAVSLRFVFVNDVWRAFHATHGAFIAQWWPKQGENGRWTRARTRARRPNELEDRENILAMTHVDLDALLEKDLDAKHQDHVSEHSRLRDAESEEFIRRRKEGLCTACGSEEGMLCDCGDKSVKKEPVLCDDCGVEEGTDNANIVCSVHFSNYHTFERRK